jgi:hypothetical protein
VPLEFACIRGVVHYIPKLKEDAKDLSRAQTIPLHRALDAIAVDIGVKEGWHSVIFKKWTYNNDGYIYQINPVDTLCRVKFDALDALDALDAVTPQTMIHVEMTDRLDEAVPMRDIRISITDAPGVELEGRAREYLDVFLTERTMRAGCVFAVHFAEVMLENNLHLQRAPRQHDEENYGRDGP